MKFINFEKSNEQFTLIVDDNNKLWFYKRIPHRIFYRGDWKDKITFSHIIEKNALYLIRENHTQNTTSMELLQDHIFEIKESEYCKYLKYIIKR